MTSSVCHSYYLERALLPLLNNRTDAQLWSGAQSRAEQSIEVLYELSPWFAVSDGTVLRCDTIMTDLRVIRGSLPDFLGDGSVSCIPSSSSPSYSGCISPIFANTDITDGVEGRGEEQDNLVGK